MINPVESTADQRSICALCAKEFHLPRSLRQDSGSLLPGEALYRAGQAADAVYLIESGTLDLWVEGATEPIRRAQPGELLGILAIMSNGRFVRTARAREPVAFFRIPREQFLDYLHQNPELWMQVTTQLDHEANTAVAVLRRYRAQQLGSLVTSR